MLHVQSFDMQFDALQLCYKGFPLAESERVIRTLGIPKGFNVSVLSLVTSCFRDEHSERQLPITFLSCFIAGDGLLPEAWRCEVPLSVINWPFV